MAKDAKKAANKRPAPSVGGKKAAPSVGKKQLPKRPAPAKTPPRQAPNRPASGNPNARPQQRPAAPQSRPVPNRTAAQRPAKPAPKKRRPLINLGKKRKKQPIRPIAGNNIQKPTPNPAVNAPDARQYAAEKQKPLKPVNKEARKAAEQAVRARNPQQQSRPYRGGNYSLYFIMAGIVAIIVLIILANTVLFKCTEIEVRQTSGEMRYSAEEIIERSGLVTGENLLHMDTRSAEKRILEGFAFLDKVEAKKSFPTKIIIEVTEAENWFALDVNGKKIVVSRGGRLLGEIPANGLITVKGYEPESAEEGSWLISKVEGKTEIPAEIFKTAEKVGLTDINEIDITDRFSIKITVDNRIILSLGDMTSAESKLLVAKALIDQEILPDEYVTILLTNPEKPAVQSRNPTNGGAQTTPVRNPNLPIVVLPPADETSSDESGESSDEQS